MTLDLDFVGCNQLPWPLRIDRATHLACGSHQSSLWLQTTECGLKESLIVSVFSSFKLREDVDVLPLNSSYEFKSASARYPARLYWRRRIAISCPGVRIGAACWGRAKLLHSVKGGWDSLHVWKHRETSPPLAVCQHDQSLYILYSLSY